MIISRKKLKEMENDLEFLRITVDYYKGDRDFYKREAERLRIAESLLTQDQEMEYYRLLSEQAKAEE